jgi:hypothetical protein
MDYFKCFNKIDKSKEILNIMSNFLIHNCILFTLLSLFFIFYISKLTSKIFNDEITELIDHSMHSFNKLNINKNFNLKKIINLYSTPDQTILLYNNLLKKTIFIVVIILWIVLIIIISLLKYYNSDELELTHIIIENLGIFFFIGLIEFFFFKFIALKFVPVEPSFMKKTFIEKIQKQ